MTSTENYCLGLNDDSSAAEVFDVIRKSEIPTAIAGKLLRWFEFVSAGYELGGLAYSHAIAAFTIYTEELDVYIFLNDEDLEQSILESDSLAQQLYNSLHNN